MIKPDIDVPFFKTKAFHEVVTFLTNGGKVLCLSGQWGSGKTSAAKHVYIEVTKKMPVIVRDPLELDMCDQPVILDDVLSKDISEDDEGIIMEKIKNMLKNSPCSEESPFIIVTVDGDFKTLSKSLRSFLSNRKGTKCVDLSKSFTKGDLNQILFSNFNHFCPNDDFSKFFEQIASKRKDNSLGYPEICALLCRCKNIPKMPSSLLFRNRPFQYLKSILEEMHLSDEKNKFMMLVYMSLNQMEINLNNQNDGFFELLESCNCNVEPSKSNNQLEVPNTETSGGDANLITQIPKEFNTKTERKELLETVKVGETNVCKPKELSLYTLSKYKQKSDFLPSIIPMEFADKLREKPIYRLQHGVIKRMALVVFGTHHFDKLLEYSKPEDLKGWIKEKKTLGDLLHKVEETKPYLKIDGTKWSKYKDKICKNT